MCVDCGKDTKNPKDYYMVKAVVWNKYGLGGSVDIPKKKGGGWFHKTGESSGMLCVKCLETRMGRKLIKKDLYICELNWLNPYTKALLIAKKKKHV